MKRVVERVDALIPAQPKALRVCAYARVSTGKDAMLHSLSAQVSYYSKMIQSHDGWMYCGVYSDEAVTGTKRERAGFQHMIEECRQGNIDLVITKSISRFARNTVTLLQTVRELKSLGVDVFFEEQHIHTMSTDGELMMTILASYAQEESLSASENQKWRVRKAFENGEIINLRFLFGYDITPDGIQVNEKDAAIVREIFARFNGGESMSSICRDLDARGHKGVLGGTWCAERMRNTLSNEKYLGNALLQKRYRNNHIEKKLLPNRGELPMYYAEGTHEPIIDQPTFDLVQKIRGNVRRYPNGWGEAAPLTGLLYCADCGGKMYVHRTNNGKRISQYTCSQYSKVPVGKLCTTQHRINEDVVLSLVSEMLKAIAEYAKHDRAEFVRVVQEAQSSQQTAEVRKQRTRLATAKQRVSELEVLLCKIYEDNILGKLSDSRYATLDAQYEKEQSELTAEISVLEKAVKSYEKHEKDADRFIALIDKYENFDKLTIAMLNEFIEKILVHERDRKGSIQTTQEVEIYFNFVGRFVPPAFGEVELTPEELEEIRKREERKDRLHQNYLKRKASGAQKRYEDKIKGRKKAEIEAKKAAIRAEDIAKGVFVPVSSLPQREPQKGTQIA